MSTPETATAPNPFDAKALRLNTSTRPSIGVEKRIVTVPVRKPNKQNFARVHPGADYTGTFAVIELRDEGETYLVTPELIGELASEITYVQVHTAIDPQGNLFVWPVKLPADDSNPSNWHVSHGIAAETAKTEWVKISANRAMGAYEVHAPVGTIPDPEWPKVTFSEILEKAFRDKFVRDLNHPVVKRLQGRV